jgi:hypothetical protein
LFLALRAFLKAPEDRRTPKADATAHIFAEIDRSFRAAGLEISFPGVKTPG